MYAPHVTCSENVVVVSLDRKVHVVGNLMPCLRVIPPKPVSIENKKGERFDDMRVK